MYLSYIVTVRKPDTVSASWIKTGQYKGGISIMKKRTLLLAGILSGSMMLSMGGAMSASAEEKTSAQTTEAADAKSTDASQDAESTDASQETKSTDASQNAESTDASQEARKPMPPAFRMRDRAMQPPQNQPEQKQDNGSENGSEEKNAQPEMNGSNKTALPDGKTPNENGACGSKATSRFFKPKDKPETKPDAEDAVKNARDPWGTTDTDPYDAEKDPANGQAPQGENGQAPQGENGQAPQGENGQAPQGGAPLGNA